MTTPALDYQTIGFIVTTGAAVFGLFVAVAKLGLAQFEKRIGEKFAALEKSIGEENQQVRDLKNKVDALTALLPVEYVRREDWIRFSTVIDTKLDRLGERLSDLMRSGGYRRGE